MAIRNAAASAVLGLLFLSLVVIYLLIPQNGLVTFLCILILIVSLIVAQSQRWRDIAVMAVLAAIVSLVAAFLFGRARFGDIGGIVALLVWGGMLLLLFNWTQRNMRLVPKDRAILIRNQYTGIVRSLSGQIAPPLIPFSERIIAEIPLYELRCAAKIEKVNAKAGHNIDEIELEIYYQVDPNKTQSVVAGIPNRSQLQEETANSLKMELREARCNVIFWEKLLCSQMEITSKEIVRDVIYLNNFAQNAIEIYGNRKNLEEEIKARLNERAQSWGIRITLLEITRILNNPDVVRGIKKKDGWRDDTELENIKADREAYRIRVTGQAQAEAEAIRVARIVRALQETGVDISADELHDIVLDAIHASADVNMETALARPMLEGPAPKPTGGAKDNVAKK